MERLNDEGDERRDGGTERCSKRERDRETERQRDRERGRETVESGVRSRFLEPFNDIPEENE